MKILELREEEIVALRTHIEEILSEVKFQRDNLNGVSERTFSGNEYVGTLNFLLDKYQRFRDDYNQLVSQRNLKEYTKIEKIEKAEEDDIPLGRIRGGLNDIRRNLEVASNVLNKLENKSVEAEKVARLTSLKDSVNNKLSDNYPILSRNLKNSIDTLEDGHPKSSSLLAAGTVDHAMSELQSQLEAGDWDKAIAELENREILNEETEGRIHRALKEGRNELVHELTQSPDVEDALLTISGAVQFLDKLQNVQDIDVALE